MRAYSAQQKKPRERCARTVLAWLTLVAVLSTSFGFHAPRAQAALVPVADVANLVQNTISAVANTTIAAAEETLIIKEWTVDGIFNGLAKTALQLLLKETVRWINSGFQGSPAFVQDLDGFLLNSADKLAGEIIYGSELNALCRPFALDVRITLSLLRSRREAPVRCTLSQVVGNVDNFFNDLASGGLAGWFAMTVNPNNNFFGASAAAQSHLFGRIGDQKGLDLQEFLANNGFLAKKECKKVPDADADGNEFMREECKTVLPGNTIAEALNSKLTIPDNTLISADEVNEVLSALFQQLALKAFTGARGLLTLSDRGAGGEPAYLDRVGNPAYDALPGQNAIGNDFISRAIRDESAYRALYAAPVARADAIVARIATLEAQDAAEEDFECSDMSGLRARVLAIRAQLLPKLQAADANLATLRDMEARYQAEFSAAGFSRQAQEERLRVVETFTNLAGSGRLHDETHIVREEPQVTPLAGELNTIASQVESSCRRIETESSSGGGSEG